MHDDLIKEVRRYSSLFEHGLLTEREFANQLFDLYVESNASDTAVAAAFDAIPKRMMQTVHEELHRLAEADFYRRTLRLGDTRTEDEMHADALACQPALRRICHVLTPLILTRMTR